MSGPTILRTLAVSALFGAAAAGGVQSQTGAVRGVVFDSIAEAPLKDAAVFLWNTHHRATSDGEGHFLLPDVPVGDYTLLFFHQQLGEMGISPGPKRIHVAAGDTVDVDLGTPSPFTLQVSRCLLETPQPGRVAVAGRISDGETGMPLPAHVTLSWKAEGAPSLETLELAADDNGWYGTCAAPADVPITAAADFFDRQGLRREVTVADHGNAQVSFRLWRLTDASVRGQVRDATSGDAVSDAEVWLRGTPFRAITGSAGDFRFGEVPPGTYTLVMRHLGYGTRTDTLTVVSGRNIAVNMRVDSRAIEIEPLTVTADAVPVTRRAMGGYSVTKADIEKVRSRVRDVGDILRVQQVPGVIVRRRGDNSLCVGYTSGQARVYNNTSGGCVPMTVFINDVRATNTDLALQMPVESIDRIVVFRPLEAGNLFGAGSSNGVLVIYTHNR